MTTVGPTDAPMTSLPFTVLARTSDPEPDPVDAVHLDLTAAVSCRIALLEGRLDAAVSSVTVAQQPDGSVDDRDLHLARALLGDDAPVAALSAYAVALQHSDGTATGVLRSVEVALAAADLIDRLPLPSSASTDAGVHAVWQVALQRGALALGALPSELRAQGGNQLRSSVLPLARVLSERSGDDELSRGRLTQLVETWPISAEDKPIVGDDGLAELWRRVAEDADDQARREERELARARRSAGPAVGNTPQRLDVDVTALARIGLIDPGRAPQVQPIGPEQDRAFLVRIPVRRATGTALDEVLEARSAAAGQKLDQHVAALTVAYAHLLAETFLPYSLTDFLDDTAKVEPSPPHLADVVCSVRNEPWSDRAAQFGLRETFDEDAQRWELRTTIPHRGHPNGATLAIHLRAERTPMFRNDRKTTTRQVLELRQAWRTGTYGPADQRRLRTLQKDLRSIGEASLADALEREYDAYRRATPAQRQTDLSVIADVIRARAEELAAELRAADADDIPGVTARCQELWQTRAYLIDLRP